MTKNRILQKLRANQPTRGAWLGIPNPHTARLLSALPLDWMIIDMEHAPTTKEIMCHMIAGIAASGGPQPVVRLAEANSENIKSALDAGAAGIIAPMVNTGAEAARVVSWAKLPPIGTRSFGSSYAGLAWGQSMAENARLSNDQVLVAVQVESKHALDNLDDIFGTPSLDMVLVGPLDLSLSLGIDFFSGESSPQFDQAMESILAASRRHNVPLGIFCPSPEVAKQRIEQGFLFVNVALDTFILERGVREAIKISGG